LRADSAALREKLTAAAIEHEYAVVPAGRQPLSAPAIRLRHRPCERW
jgi:hypothetical protein